MTLTIPPELAPYLERLAALGVNGDTPGAVAEHLLRNAVARELRLDGLLREFTAAWNAAEEGRRTLGVDLYGGDYDFGGHTAMDRLRAAMGTGPSLDAVYAERNGQTTLLGE
jgi:hypothetical protein